MAISFRHALALPVILIAGTAVGAPVDGTTAVPVPVKIRQAGFKALLPLSFDNPNAPTPLIRQASIEANASSSERKAGRDGFLDAPLPNDDMDDPKGAKDYSASSVRPDFFRRDHHQVGDALAGGAAVNDQRRGHGSMAAGLALAVPMD